MTTSSTAVFQNNSANDDMNYGMARGIIDFLNLNWSGQNSLLGTRNPTPPSGVHLLNNYDI